MDVKLCVFSVVLFAIVGHGQAQCTTYNCSNGYCCDYNTCCYSVYLSWWFWLIVVGVFLLKVACITCYVRRRRQRAEMFYVQAPVNTTVNIAQPAGVYPHQHVAPSAQMPPPYTAGGMPQAPQYPQQPYATGDTRVNKDTQMLVG